MCRRMLMGSIENVSAISWAKWTKQTYWIPEWLQNPVPSSSSSFSPTQRSNTKIHWLFSISAYSSAPGKLEQMYVCYMNICTSIHHPIFDAFIRFDSCTAPHRSLNPQIDSPRISAKSTLQSSELENPPTFLVSAHASVRRIRCNSQRHTHATTTHPFYYTLLLSASGDVMMIPCQLNSIPKCCCCKLLNLLSSTS